jgi:hypothetical protein
MNNVENKNDLNKMSDLEFGKNKVEMMRYRDNSLSYKLGLGAIACSMLAGFICLNSFDPSYFMTLFAILLNIVLLLGGFLAVEKTRAYSFKASVGMIVFGVVCGLRIIWIPLNIIIQYNQWLSTGDDAAYMYLGRTITTNNYNQLTYLPQSGVFRGVIAIVFLVAAAAMFIVAGYLGMVRSRRLTTYLNSIKQK